MPAPPSAAGYYRLKRARPVVRTVPLTYPIAVCGEEVAELWITRPTLGMLRGVDVGGFLASFAAMAPQAGASKDDVDAGAMMSALPKNLVDVVLQLVPGIAQITSDEAESLDGAELWTLMEVVVDFFGSLAPSGASGP